MAGPDWQFEVHSKMAGEEQGCQFEQVRGCQLLADSSSGVASSLMNEVAVDSVSEPVTVAVVEAWGLEK